MAYPNSSDVVAGTQAVASAVNAIRKDAIGKVDIVSANTFGALKVIKNFAGGFILFDNQWGPTNVEIMISATAGSGGYTSSTAYKPGSIIPGFGGTLTVDAIYYPDGSGNLTTTPGLIRIPLGVALTTSVLLFNPKVSSFKVTPGTSGAALSTGQLVYRKASDAKWYPTDPTSRESGHCKDVGFVAFGAGAADVAINVILPGQIVSGLSGLTAGTVYYPGASGTLSATRGAFSRPLGIAKSTTELAFFPLEPNENFVLEAVTAGENWSARDLLYFKKSDQRYWKADADAAESGICEVPAIAFATHSGGGGSQQLVYMPGSYIRGAGFSFTAGDRLFPSGTAGAYVANTPASYDTFYRPVAHAIETDFVLFTPHAMEFLPTGIQEKGYVGGGNSMSGTSAVAASPYEGVYYATNFKKIMVNTPASITLTTDSSNNSATLIVDRINRFGFLYRVNYSAGSSYAGTNTQTWIGSFYQTVGN